MPSSTLEDTIRDLVKRGEMSHLSLAQSQHGRMWRASFTMCSKFGVSFSEDPDPVKALSLAMTSAKMKPRGKTTREEKSAQALGTAAIPQKTIDADRDEDIESLM